MIQAKRPPSIQPTIFVNMTNTRSGSLSKSIVGGFKAGNPYFHKPHHSLNPGSLNGHTLMHAVQQSILVLTMH